VQVDPIKATLKAPGTQRLKLQYDEPLSNFAFKFNLRRYNSVWSIGASVDEEGRKKFDSMLRKLLVNDPPAALKMWMTSPARKVTQLIPEVRRCRLTL